jgi:CRISPR system Cascade subunit CasA
VLHLLEKFPENHTQQGFDSFSTQLITPLNGYLLHHVYLGPKDEDKWEEIQEDNGQKVIAYLESHQDRFDLFHPEYPFMQDVALSQVKPVPIYALHTMSQCRVFSHEHEWSGYTLMAPEAARLLVRLQGMDITSLRAFYVGQSSGNRSAVNTPPINAANVLIQGENLRQTLLLNLIRYDPGSNYPSVINGPDIPFWEIGYAGKPIKAVPAGYIQYLTFPWRRLKLFGTPESISEIAITMGHSLPDKVSPQK